MTAHLLITLGGCILLGAFLAIVAGIALCARYDREYFGVDDMDCHP